MNLLTSRPLRACAALALAAGLTLGLGACSSGTSGSPSVAQDSMAGSARDAASGAAGAPQAAKEGAAAPTVDRKIVRRADTSLLVKDVGAAAEKVRAIATTAGGSVVSESLSAYRGTDSGNLSGTITIAVPSDKLDDTMKRLAELGDVVSRSTSSDDVTAQYVDTESRLATMTASVERVRALMAQATKIEDIVALESELSRRQADLESMEAQLRALKDQVAQSPISVQLSTDRSELSDSGGGFLSGLKAGWKAFTSSVVVLLTVIGALLPFLVAAAIILAPIVWFLRRRHAARNAPVARPSATAHTHAPAQPTDRPAPPAQSQPEQPQPEQPQP